MLALWKTEPGRPRTNLIKPNQTKTNQFVDRFHPRFWTFPGARDSQVRQSGHSGPKDSTTRFVFGVCRFVLALVLGDLGLAALCFRRWLADPQARIALAGFGAGVRAGEFWRHLSASTNAHPHRDSAYTRSRRRRRHRPCPAAHRLSLMVVALGLARLAIARVSVLGGPWFVVRDSAAACGLCGLLFSGRVFAGTARHRPVVVGGDFGRVHLLPDARGGAAGV